MKLFGMEIRRVRNETKKLRLCLSFFVLLIRL